MIFEKSGNEKMVTVPTVITLPVVLKRVNSVKVFQQIKITLTGYTKAIITSNSKKQ